MTRIGFFDLSDRYASLDTKKDPLVEVDAVVPWEDFRPTLERVWRKPMDPVLMFKTLVLSALYNLSDHQFEYQLRDRPSTGDGQDRDEEPRLQHAPSRTARQHTHLRNRNAPGTKSRHRAQFRPLK